MIKRRHIPFTQASRYLLVGSLSALTDYVSFVFLLHGVSVSLFMATSVSYLMGFAVNFFGHARFTFRVSPEFKTVVKYTTSAILHYGLSLGIMFAGTSMFYSPEFWKVVCFCVIAVNGFVIGRLWIFRSNKQN